VYFAEAVELDRQNYLDVHTSGKYRHRYAETLKEYVELLQYAGRMDLLAQAERDLKDVLSSSQA